VQRTFTSEQVNMTLGAHTSFFVTKVTKLGFDAATGATENLQKTDKLFYLTDNTAHSFIL